MHNVHVLRSDYKENLKQFIQMQISHSTFHLVRTHLGLGGGEGEVKSPIHFHRDYMQKGGGGPDSMYYCVCTKWKAPYI